MSERGLLARALWPFPRYLNSVLFLPENQTPGTPGLCILITPRDEAGVILARVGRLG